MDNDDEKREIEYKIIKREIEDKKKEIEEEKLKLKKKLENANTILNSLNEAVNEAVEEYDNNPSEQQEKKIEGIYKNMSIKYENALKEYNNADEKYHEFLNEQIKLINDKYKVNLMDYYDKEAAAEAEAADLRGGKRKTKAYSKKVAKKLVASQKKQSIYKEILGKQMKIYKMPDSRKEYVKYKGDLHLITDYKDLMKQKANAKPKAKPKK